MVKLTPTTAWLSAQSANAGTQVDVDALSTEFFANGYSTTMHQRLVECCSYSDSGRECSVVVSVSHTERAILETT
jgi:hypothetical protein